MKHKISSLLVLLLVAGSVLPACSSAPGGGKCEGGLCIDVELTEPIRMNEPVPVTITVESTEEDKQGLKVSLWFSAPDIQVDGEREWVVDLKAHTSMQFSTTIRFPAREGSYDVVAGALDYQHGRMVRDYVPVRITVLGGTLYPPSEFTPGVPEPVTTIEVTPLSPLPTPAPETPQPEEQPDETLGSTPTPSPIIVVVNQEVNVPIPDDSTWLTFTIPITTAPSGVTVVGAHAKFLVIHPRGQDLVAEVIGPDGATVYRVWDHKRPVPEDFSDEGRLVPRAYDIPVFIGQPVNGNWTLRLRDERRGKTGTVLIVTLAVAYMPPESGHTTPLRPEVGQVSPEAQSAVAGSWQTIITQTFEGVFPSAGWMVRDLNYTDVYTRYWDDDDYRPHWGSRAAWPARGGIHGRNPVAGNDVYAQWVSLGTYYLPQGSHSKVYLDDMTGNQNYAQEEIGFDAVKFVCLDCGLGPTSTPGPTTTPRPTSTPRPTHTPPPPTATPTKPAPAVIGRADWNCPTDEIEAPYTTPVAQEPVMVILHRTTSRNDPAQETRDSNDKYDWATWSDLWFGGIPQGTVAEYCDPIKDTWAGEVLMTWLVERYKNGWTDIAYHYLIDGNGNVYQGSYYGIDFERGATCSEISWMIQVALLGCFEPDACEREGGAVTPSSTAIDSLEALIEWLGCSETRFLLPDGGTENNIKGHRDIDNGSDPNCPTTDCPGENLYSLLPEVRRRSNCGVSSRQVQFVGLEPWSQSTSAPSETESVPEYYITVMGHEGVEIYVIDPEGKRLGNAPLSGEIVNEIPGADFQDNPMWGYEASRGDAIAEPAQLVIAHIPLPVEGLYRVQIHGTLGALGGGLSLSARHGGDLKAMRMVIIEPGQQLPTEYQFIYSLDNEELVTNLFQDVAAPTTTHQFLGTEGNNGWFVTDVTVVLEAMDDLSGVDFTTYRLGSSDWVTYTEPIVVSDEGTHALQYRSTDRVGNQENERSIAVNLDKTPPVVTITQPAVTTYTLGSTFIVKYEAHDAISGLDVITAMLDGEAIANGQMFDTLFMLPGPHEIVVMAQDLAGWQTTQSRTLVVQVTIEGLVNAKHRLYDMGWIYGSGARGIVNSLDAKLEAAIRARDRGQLHTATNIINAFVHEVEAQTGKHITLEAAAILIRSAQHVTNQLVQQIPVSPGFGGSLFSPDEVIRVDFPPSAVTELAIATYQLVTETQSLMTTRSPIGRIFDLDATWYGNGEPVGNFLRPVIIVVGYNESDLGRADEARLALHYWDGEKWIEVSTMVETEQNRALATVNHFTTYALMEREHKIYLPLVLAVVFLSGVTPFVPQVITRSRYLTARSGDTAGANPTGSIKIIALVALSTAIGVCMVGCKTSNEGKAFPTDSGEATSPSESLLQETISGCHITIMGHEGVEIYITDPVGRHLGIAPLSRGIVSEIPGGDFQDNPTWGYESSRGDSTAEPAKLVIAHIPDPVEGLYLVQVHGVLGALGGGLGVSARCSGEIKAMRMVNIEPGQELPLEYQFTYSLENEELVTELLRR